jgi:hypothetical protein
LEFDIGFLLDVCFLIPSAAHRNIGTALSGAGSVDVPDDRKRGSASTAAFDAAAPASDGIWYARDEVVKAAAGSEARKTLAT